MTRTRTRGDTDGDSEPGVNRPAGKLKKGMRVLTLDGTNWTIDNVEVLGSHARVWPSSSTRPLTFHIEDELTIDPASLHAHSRPASSRTA
jgi:hypothetical protein